MRRNNRNNIICPLGGPAKVEEAISLSVKGLQDPRHNVIRYFYRQILLTVSYVLNEHVSVGV